jgi:hypothetical protein
MLARSCSISLATVLIALTFALAACGGDDPDDDAPACRTGECCVTPDDGLCEAAGGCGSICLRTHADDAAAIPAVADFEARMAREEGRAPRSFIAPGDPRFVRARDLLEQTWELFRASRTVGALHDQRIALVLIDDPKPNAFIFQPFGFTVVAQAGLLTTQSSDEALLGVMAHELQHLLGQDASANERLRDFYLAPAGEEPIGRNQPDDLTARALATPWRAASQEAGIYSLEELGGMPRGGRLAQLFKLALSHGTQLDPARCANTVSLIDRFEADLSAATDRVSGALQLDLATLPARVQQILDAMRLECLAGFTPDAVDLLAELGGTTRDQVLSSLTEHDRTLVVGQHVVDGISALVRDRRAAMRAAESELATRTGRPWSALRFFSIEEDADDVSLAVLRAGGLAPDAVRSFFLAVLPSAARTTCAAALDAGTVPPYGLDLLDDHHGTCWRAYHVHALAETTAPVRRTLAPGVSSPESAPAAPPALPIPPPLSDLLVY